MAENRVRFPAAAVDPNPVRYCNESSRNKEANRSDLAAENAGVIASRDPK
jgi:hypothetical protein